ncbi:Signal transduction histidine kinase [Evansella caseinilytica]|uniref:histidine kinase n=1 Tax=Evansella caseinilytica TaxID=1503961 RepID=A0A1H3K389_9BACI|nr:HAMP domain-containing sensor histidine kinase [Evansella caseinilytica]SDY46621.1 Signal transduction histidine kinase [Evansella caseinilytica]
MMTCQKNVLATHLDKFKTAIVAEIVATFKEFFGSCHVDTRVLTSEVTKLFDCFLAKLTGSVECDILSSGVKIETYRIRGNIAVTDLFAFLDDSRSIVENWVWKQQLDIIEKTNGIAKLNEVYIELYKAISLYSDKQRKEELHKKNQEMDKLLEDRAQILTKLSNSFAHEIRNPLTSIKGFIQLLESRLEKPAHERMYFQYINQEIKELEEQVNQILYLSNRKNHEDYRLRKISLNSLVIHALKTFKPIFNDHRIQVDVKLMHHLVINGVEDQLKLALYKLIQNAIDALMLRDLERKIKIVLYEDNNDICLSISNNGPPISSLIKNSIFDPFVSTKELGKGIGLAITKQIVEKHDGTIHCWSKGQWTTFKLSFKLGHVSIGSQK